MTMSPSILEAEDRVCSLHRDYFMAMRNAAYNVVPWTRPNIAIRHILSKLRPHYVKARKAEFILCQKRTIWQKDFDALTRVMTAQKKQLQQERGLLATCLAWEVSSEEKAHQVSVRPQGRSSKKFKKFRKSFNSTTRVNMQSQCRTRHKAPKTSLPPCQDPCAETVEERTLSIIVPAHQRPKKSSFGINIDPIIRHEWVHRVIKLQAPWIGRQSADPN